MRKNYRFEILAALFHANETMTDILPLIEKLADENIFSRMYFNIVLQSMRDSELITFTDDGDEICAQLLAAGMDEYKRLKKHAVHFNPAPINKK